MLEIRQTTAADLENVRRLWADGNVMYYVGFPEGIKETDESMREWYERLVPKRPLSEHYSIYEDGAYCGETGYSIDRDHASASLDIKLFAFARGRGLAARALTHAIGQAFQTGAQTVWVDPDPRNAKAIALYERLGFTRKEMPAHVAALGEDPKASLYYELCKG